MPATASHFVALLVCIDHDLEAMYENEVKDHNSNQKTIWNVGWPSWKKSYQALSYLETGQFKRHRNVFEFPGITSGNPTLEAVEVGVIIPRIRRCTSFNLPPSCRLRPIVAYVGKCRQLSNVDKEMLPLGQRSRL
jgi:hypothetical protein